MRHFKAESLVNDINAIYREQPYDASALLFIVEKNEGITDVNI